MVLLLFKHFCNDCKNRYPVDDGVQISYNLPLMYLNVEEQSNLT